MTIVVVFLARQHQEQCQEQNVDLYTRFVDLTKAFESVSRDGLGNIMVKFGCLTIVRYVHDGIQARIQNDGAFSENETFHVTNGVKMTGLLHQHCSAPCLWILFWILILVFFQLDTAIQSKKVSSQN